MKRIIIIAVLAYLVYYLYNKKNTGASATKKGTENNLDMILGKLDTAIAKTIIDPSPAEISLVDPVGTSNANIAALQPQVTHFSISNLPASFFDFRPEDIRYAAPQIIEERTPGLTGDTPYWMPNQEMIYPRGFDQYNTM